MCRALSVSSRTIAVERSAYERLKAARRPGESFTDAINRLLEGREPRLLDFVGLFDRKAADEVARSVALMREEELEHERALIKKRR
jgi:predicted CopG family antitoxin